MQKGCSGLTVKRQSGTEGYTTITHQQRVDHRAPARGLDARRRCLRSVVSAALRNPWVCIPLQQGPNSLEPAFLGYRRKCPNPTTHPPRGTERPPWVQAPAAGQGGCSCPSHPPSLDPAPRGSSFVRLCAHRAVPASAAPAPLQSLLCATPSLPRSPVYLQGLCGCAPHPVGMLPSPGRLRLPVGWTMHHLLLASCTAAEATPQKCRHCTLGRRTGCEECSGCVTVCVCD